VKQEKEKEQEKKIENSVKRTLGSEGTREKSRR
jgi:hypothetical protein